MFFEKRQDPLLLYPFMYIYLCYINSILAAIEHTCLYSLNVFGHSLVTFSFYNLYNLYYFRHWMHR